MKSKPDLSRLRIEYEDRARRMAGSDLYSPFNPATLFAVQQRQRAVLRILKQLGHVNLPDLRILEVGCGSGGVLTEFLGFGASPQDLYGLDLLPGRLTEAKQRLMRANFLAADGSEMPFPDHSFDLVLQYTAVSSILDRNLRRLICAEMLRVVRPNGLILSYDFWLNPTNKQTRGLGISEIRSSFPGCHIEPHRITLAPPITRRLASVSWFLCLFLESLKIFNTHYLVAITQNEPSPGRSGSEEGMGNI